MVIGVIRSGFTYIKLDGSYQLIAMGGLSLQPWFSTSGGKNNSCEIGKEGYLMDDVKTNDLGDIILETRLTKHYGGVHALEGANFTLRKGEHVAIVGDNGGKINLVRQITGVEQRTRGDIIFDGKSVNFVEPLRHGKRG